MSNDYYIVSGDSLRGIANKIREKGDTSEQLTFPQGFIDAIDAISGDEEPITTYLTYASYDGSTIYKIVTCLDGVPQETAPADPTREPTAANTFTFVGWSKSMNATTADADAQTDVIADRTIYAAYTAQARTYTVRFYNGSTLLETDTGVPYGGSTTYDGATPVSPIDASYTFNGWSPAPTNIQGDTSCYAQYDIGVEVKEIADSWDTIIANIDNGTYKTAYKIGNYKPLDLGTKGTVNMQIVAMDTDDLASGGKAPLTLIAKELLTVKMRMNLARTANTEGTGTLGGWEKCEMRTYLKNTIKPLIPAEVRNRIVEVTKHQKAYAAVDETVFQQTTTDDVWIPSHREINNNTEKDTGGYAYSTIYKDAESRSKNRSGSAAWWWLRSASTVTTWCNVIGSGSDRDSNSDISGGVCLGFCLGLES